MYFSSEVGKGFIISDDEEVTGVISVMNTLRKKSKGRVRQPSESKMETLQRRAKRKQSKKNNIPNFLFVNKPHFSSNSSLEIGLNKDFSDLSFQSEYKQNRPGAVGGGIDRRYRSEIMLTATSR